MGMVFYAVWLYVKAKEIKEFTTMYEIKYFFIANEMETLASDMASMMSSKKGSQSILDVVGADMNTSYDRAMQVQLVSDTFHISAGG